MYRIGELAEAANVSKRTIDYYTRLGLLHYERNQSNYRHYSEEALQRLKLIELYKRGKMTLEEIRERLEWLDENRIPAKEAFQKMNDICLRIHQLEENILELTPILSKLNEKQYRVLTQKVSVQCTSLIHTLHQLLGENQLIDNGR
ncbi:MAG TPA: MerR family transcriptional regulator [Paenibacillaceae bacterium]|nr:MerR family transcriptional regulator [Paenibacillaceae bacterium]